LNPEKALNVGVEPSDIEPTSTPKTDSLSLSQLPSTSTNQSILSPVQTPTGANETLSKILASGSRKKRKRVEEQDELEVALLESLKSQDDSALLGEEHDNNREGGGANESRNNFISYF